MRLIDADMLKEQIDKQIEIYYNDNGGGIHLAEEVIEWVELMMPTVDAESVIRCKDCIYCKAYNDVWYLPKKDALVCINDEIEVNADDYCSWGERKK